MDDGSSVHVELDDDPLASDVATVKAVTGWCDHRHDSGSAPHDKVHVALQVYDTLHGSWGTVKSSTTADNKQRGFIDGPVARRSRLKIAGADVTSDVEGCGTGSRRACFA